MVLIGITFALIVNSFIDTSYGYKALAQAQAAATAGAEDAVLRLDRNASFSSTGGYAVAVGSTTAMVTVTPSSTSPGIVTILSAATVANRTRKVNVVASVNATTSQVNIVSWQLAQ